ncbi:acyl-CoA carboxylase subunit epsilon [Streptomyces sp. NPDC021100]|uniref:acyl-CoA carboxylase subunit epsilon n=1 Tax=unclassified Streptomyces TaxID=2593676 RepID=UPI0037B0AB33
MTDTLVRVEKGTAGPEELAAVTAVLLARASAGSSAPVPGPRRSAASWRRLERSGGFTAAHSWQG